MAVPATTPGDDDAVVVVENPHKVRKPTRSGRNFDGAIYTECFTRHEQYQSATATWPGTTLPKTGLRFFCTCLVSMGLAPDDEECGWSCDILDRKLHTATPPTLF